MKDFLELARKFGYEEVERTGMPLKLHVDLACQVGKRLAEILGANVEIVEIGTLLMDCMIGQAIKQGKLNEHIRMSAEKADELLSHSNLSSKDKENIRHCVLEHHGADKFYSLESEICCNADCYRFTSVKGFSYAMRYMREMPFVDMVNLLENKVAEKWGLVSLDICKKELSPQHSVLKSFLKKLKA
ncbi:MAG: hypothetical protein NUV65_06710 [Candidatus Roizmanbacteria bacterium]|nr:hypothetical protein [Candidatus Roizmanbacteria bacterium]